MTGQQNTNSDKTPPRPGGAGVDWYFDPNDPQDQFRLWGLGDSYPRFVFDPATGSVAAGVGVAPPVALGTGGGGGGLPVGGTGGQVLAKVNGTDFNVAWVAPGATFRYGSGAPAGGLGADGDGYLDLAAGTVYGPKASGAWPAGVNVLAANLAGAAPAGAAIATSQARVWWDPNLKTLNVRGKDNIGTVFDQVVGQGAQTAGVVIAEDAAQLPSAHVLAAPPYTRNAVIDFPSVADATGAYGGGLVVSFVAPCDQVRVELIVPSFFNNSANALANVQFIATVPFGNEVVRLSSPTLPATSGAATPDMVMSQIVNVVVGNTYTFKVQVNVPTTTAVPTFGNAGGFGTTFVDEPAVLRVTGAS